MERRSFSGNACAERLEVRAAQRELQRCALRRRHQRKMFGGTPEILRGRLRHTFVAPPNISECLLILAARLRNMRSGIQALQAAWTAVAGRANQAAPRFRRGVTMLKATLAMRPNDLTTMPFERSANVEGLEAWDPAAADESQGTEDASLRSGCG